MVLTQLRGFISYSSQDRQRAAEVKGALTPLGVDCFMAHEDIKISEAWRDMILQELRQMQVFVPLLSLQFKKSDWTSQEVGIAVTRDDVLIVPVSLDGTIPFGFMARLQGKPLPQPATPDFFFSAIASRFPRTVLPHSIERLESAATFRHAEGLMGPIVPFFDQLTATEASRLAEIASGNGQIWDAALCRDRYLPDFLAKNTDKLESNAARLLRDRISYGSGVGAMDLS